MKLSFIHKLHSNAAVMKTVASYSPNSHQCAYFPLCVKTRACVLNFYHFLNHTSSVATVKGVSSKVLHRKQFSPLFSQESNFRGFWLLKENYFQLSKSQSSEAFILQTPSMITHLNTILPRLLSSLENYTFLWTHTTSLLKAPEYQLRTFPRTDRMSEAGPNTNPCWSHPRSNWKSLGELQ